MKLLIDEINGEKCLSGFHGKDFTSDKLLSLVREWRVIVTARVDVKTTDGYLLRLLAIAFTKR